MLKVFPNAEVLADEAARLVCVALREALEERAQASLVLSGGSTPRALHQRLTLHVDRLDWSRVQVFWSDERCVPPGHPESNYRMAQETLLQDLPIPPHHIHRMACEDACQEAAKVYTETLHATVGTGDTLFDVSILGMGEDGHTASLFPGSPLLKEQAWVGCAEAPPSSPVRQRMTLTLTALNASRLALFMVTGRAKREALTNVLNAETSEPLPAALVQPAGDLYWYVDSAAAPA